MKKRPSMYAATHLGEDLTEIPGHESQKSLFGSRLPYADPKDVRIRPGAKIGAPTDVFVYIQFSRFRAVDIKGGGVGVCFFLCLQWETTLAGHQIENKETLWKPDLVFLNNDSLVVTKSIMEFFPQTGLVRNILSLSGTIANVMSLRYFPWDVDRVDIKMVLNMESGDHDVRIFWQHNRFIESCTPKTLEDDLPEWHQDPGLNTLERLPSVGQFVGHYNGIEFGFIISRFTSYYLSRVISVLCILTALGWTSLLINDDRTELQNNATSMEDILGPETFNVDNNSLVNRLNHLMAVILACVAFQYVVGSSLPKVNYMTTMDSIIMCSTLNVFFMAVEAVIVRQLSSIGLQKTAYWVDKVCLCVLPLGFCIPVATFIAFAVFQRRSKVRAYRTARWPSGIQPSLCIDDHKAVADVLFNKHCSMRISRSSTKGLSSTVIPVESEIAVTLENIFE